MKTVMTLANSSGQTVQLEQGWSWSAFLFPPAWAIYHGLGKIAAIYAVGLFALFFCPLLGPIVATIVTAIGKIAYFLGMFICGAAGNDLRKIGLEARGFKLVPPAEDGDGAPRQAGA